MAQSASDRKHAVLRPQTNASDTPNRLLTAARNVIAREVEGLEAVAVALAVGAPTTAGVATPAANIGALATTSRAG